MNTQHKLLALIFGFGLLAFGVIGIRSCNDKSSTKIASTPKTITKVDTQVKIQKPPQPQAGSLDTTFNKVGYSVDASALGSIGKKVTYDAKGRYLVAGMRSNGKFNKIAVWRYLADGTPDSTFGTKGLYVNPSITGYDRDNAGAIAVTKAGKILVSGYTDTANYPSKAFIFQLNDQGVLDPTFGKGGIVLEALITGGRYQADLFTNIMIGPQGKILIVGRSSDSRTINIVVMRYNANGTRDASFGGGDGLVFIKLAYSTHGFAIDVDKQGNIYAGGSTYKSRHTWSIWKFTSAGVLDTTFGKFGQVMESFAGSKGDMVQSIAIDESDNIYAAGYLNTGVPTGLIVKYDPKGARVADFGTAGKLLLKNEAGPGKPDSNIVHGITFDASGKLLVSGYGHNGGNNDFIIRKLNPTDGSYDTAFNATGYHVLDDLGGGAFHDSAYDIIEDAAGKLVVVGYSSDANRRNQTVIMRLHN